MRLFSALYQPASLYRQIQAHRLVLAYRLMLAGALLYASAPANAQSQPDSFPGSTIKDGQIMIDDFESYSDGALPVGWKAQLNGRLVPLTHEFVNDSEWFYVQRESGNGFARAFADGEAVHVNKRNGDGFDWDVRTHPYLSWQWRANELPEGAREDNDRLNDSGAGLYVVFAMEGRIIRRPKAIKYVYSTTLPVGTTVSFGKLKVIVVDSGKDGTGSWKSVKRNVVEDYRMVFGGDPPSKPLYLRLWSDSDDTESVSMADFDNVMLSDK